MKLLIVITTISIIAALGFRWLYKAGTTTRKDQIGEITDGNDRLTLHAIYTSHWGNSYSARTLSFNGHLVDFRGSLLHHEGEGNKTFPLDARHLRFTIIDHSPQLRQTELNDKQLADLAGHVPYNLLEKQYADPEKGAPWTLWINPTNFSTSEYDRIVALLRERGHELSKQQMQFESDTARVQYQWLRYPVLYIWRTVYHDYATLKTQIFERKNGKVEEKIIIAAHGAVEFRHKSELYKFGFGCVLGQLTDKADSLILSPVWKGSDVHFPISEFEQFKDAEGQSLTSAYKIVAE